MLEASEVIYDFEEVVNEGFATLCICRKVSNQVSKSIVKNNATTPLLSLQDIMPKLQRPLDYIIDKKLKMLQILVSNSKK